MHIGLIVGIGPAATDHYYRGLLRVLGAYGAELDLTMAHADTATLLRHQGSGDTGGQVAIYDRLAHRLRAAGAEAVAITSIAGHFCIEAFKQTSPLPVIDLLLAVDRAIAARGLRKVGIIGTRVAMQSRFYGALTTAQVVCPEGQDLDRVHDAYVAMASAGTVTDAQREVFFGAGRDLVEQAGAEAVMLGGTDLALAFDGWDCGFPTFDCAGAHIEAIAEAARAG